MTSLLTAVALTVIVEVTFYLCVRCRSRDFLIAAALVNVASNLLLNVALVALGPAGRGWALPVGEVVVVVAEWLVLRAVWQPGRPGLLWRVCAANALSVAIGFLVMPALA